MAHKTSLIHKIYDSILHPDHWKETLSEFAEKAEAKSSVLLVTEDDELSYECMAASPGWTRRQLLEYRKKFFDAEIEIFRLLSQKHTRTFVSDKDLHTSEQDYWNKPINCWMRETLGVAHRSGAGLHIHNAWVGVITLQYGLDVKTIEKHQLVSLNQYVSHFSRAIEMSRTLSVLNKRFGACLSAIDYLEQAVLILNKNAAVVVKNIAATELLKNADGLMLTEKNQLYASDPETSKKLCLLITSSLTVFDHSRANDNYPITIKRTNQKPSYLLEATPIVDTVDKIDGSPEGVMVSIVDPATPSRVNVKGLAKLYRLTKTEESVTQLLVAGNSIDEISSLRNTSIQTVRTQVKTILQKTESKSQSNLVRLAFLLNPPLTT